jgi:hypothetical protein
MSPFLARISWPLPVHDEFSTLPRETVTRVWEGVSVDTLLAEAARAWDAGDENSGISPSTKVG